MMFGHGNRGDSDIPIDLLVRGAVGDRAHCLPEKLHYQPRRQDTFDEHLQLQEATRCVEDAHHRKGPHW